MNLDHDGSAFQTYIVSILGAVSVILTGILGWLGTSIFGRVSNLEKGLGDTRETAAILQTQLVSAAAAAGAAQTQAASQAAAFVPRAELHGYMDDLRAEWQRDLESTMRQMSNMHGDNKLQFERIYKAIERLHDRLDGGARRIQS